MEVGYQALPVAALFGVVRSSGVVSVDEKWVLVPKNDKPAGKRKRWMYVYMAVDIHTCDLLHIEIYPYNGKKEAWVFLQALKAKGYSPHYHNMCGFDGIEMARKYLFDVTCRFTPFAKDNRPVKGRELDIRGKCPLELAGYDISQMPIAQVVRGQLLGWLPEFLQEAVPSA